MPMLILLKDPLFSIILIFAISIFPASIRRAKIILSFSGMYPSFCQDQNSVLIKFVFLPPQAEPVADLNLLKDRLVLQVRGPGNIGVKQVDLPDQRFEQITYSLLINRLNQFSGLLCA